MLGAVGQADDVAGLVFVPVVIGKVAFDQEELFIADMGVRLGRLAWGHAVDVKAVSTLAAIDLQNLAIGLAVVGQERLKLSVSDVGDFAPVGSNRVHGVPP